MSRLQIEDLVNAATTGATPRGATAEDVLACARAMVALAQAVTTGDWVRLDDVTGGLGSMKARHLRQDLRPARRRQLPASGRRCRHPRRAVRNPSVAGVRTIPDAPVPDAVIHQIRAAAGNAGVALAAISSTFNAAHPDPAHRQTCLDRILDTCAQPPATCRLTSSHSAAGPATRTTCGAGTPRAPTSKHGPTPALPASRAPRARRGLRPHSRRRTRTQ